MNNEKKVLQKELGKLDEQIANLEAALEQQPDYGLGEGDPAITRWEMNQALLEQTKGRKESVVQALNRADKGAYGICTRCGQDIHPDRLAVLPDTDLCIRCARADEQMPVR
jgi:RNA polymerase-binding transcription factor DksA